MGRRSYIAGEASLTAGERSQRREISQGSRVLDAVKANFSYSEDSKAAVKLVDDDGQKDSGPGRPRPGPTDFSTSCF